MARSDDDLSSSVMDPPSYLDATEIGEEGLGGDTLLGFSDYFDPEDAVLLGKLTMAKKGFKPLALTTRGTTTGKPGGGIKPGGPGNKPSGGPKGKGMLKGPPRSQTVRQHGKVLGQARRTAKTAVLTTQKAKDNLKKHVLKTRSRNRTLVGAITKPLNAKQKQALAKLKNAAAKGDRLAGALARSTIASRKATLNLAKKAVTQRALSASLRKPKGGGTRIRGLLDAEMMGYYALIGATPDPNNPGFNTDGSFDDTWDPFSDPALSDSGLADPALSDLELGTEAPMDKDIELPPPPPMSEPILDLVKLGGILYNGEKGYPDGYCGSYGLFTRETDHNSGAPKTAGIDPVYRYGMIWGRFWDNGPEKGIPFGNELQPATWNHLHGRWILGGFRATAATHNSDGAESVDLATAIKSPQMRSPYNAAYGPLIGNPNMKDFVGMRVDGNGKMGWLPQEAPDWLTFPLKQAAALTAKAEQEARKKAEETDRLRRQKEQADLEEEAYRQDAANVLAESQAASEANVSALQQETAASQLLLDQARFEQEQQTSAASQEQQANQFLLEQMRRDAEMQQQMMQAQLQMMQQGGPPGFGYPPGYGGGIVPPGYGLPPGVSGPPGFYDFGPGEEYEEAGYDPYYDPYADAGYEEGPYAEGYAEYEEV